MDDQMSQLYYYRNTRREDKKLTGFCALFCGLGGAYIGLAIAEIAKELRREITSLRGFIVTHRQYERVES